MITRVFMVVAVLILIFRIMNRHSVAIEIVADVSAGPSVSNLETLLLLLLLLFRKWEGVVRTGWSWLRIGTGGGRL